MKRPFCHGYRERLEAKLRYKNTQISRTERLLDTLLPEQRPAFEALLKRRSTTAMKSSAELDQLQQILNEFRSEPKSHYDPQFEYPDYPGAKAQGIFCRAGYGQAKTSAKRRRSTWSPSLITNPKITWLVKSAANFRRIPSSPKKAAC